METNTEGGPGPDAARRRGQPGEMVPNPARIYDYWLGGKDHYACDREVGEQVARTAPWAPAGARASRAYLREGVLWLAAQGIDQFLDIGSGLPTAGNVHQIAQHLNPAARVVYVDHDPVVLSHARVIVAPDPGVLVLEGDLRDPAAVLAQVREHPDVLDLTRPFALLLSAVLHFVPDDARPREIIRAFRAVMAPGSHLLVSHVVADDDEAGRATRVAAAAYSNAAQPFIPRTSAEITGFFDGFTLVPPGAHPLVQNGRPSTVLGGIGVVA